MLQVKKKNLNCLEYHCMDILEIRNLTKGIDEYFPSEYSTGNVQISMKRFSNSYSEQFTPRHSARVGG